MTELAPTLIQLGDTRRGLDLALPSPILGKMIFLSLPVEGEWRYHVNPSELRAKRNLILRDRMWVTLGQACFVAIHTSGARLDFVLKVRPWKPVPASGCRGSQPGETTLLKPPDERTTLSSAWDYARGLLRRTPEQRMRIHCHHTERRIEIRVRGDKISAAPGALKALLAGLRCH
jgi:hypothetical protein